MQWDVPPTKPQTSVGRVLPGVSFFVLAGSARKTKPPAPALIAAVPVARPVTRIRFCVRATPTYLKTLAASARFPSLGLVKTNRFCFNPNLSSST